MWKKITVALYVKRCIVHNRDAARLFLGSIMYAIHSEPDIRYNIGNITGKIIVGSESDQLN